MLSGLQRLPDAPAGSSDKAKDGATFSIGEVTPRIADNMPVSPRSDADTVIGQGIGDDTAGARMESRHLADGDGDGDGTRHEGEMVVGRFRLI